MAEKYLYGNYRYRLFARIANMDGAGMQELQAANIMFSVMVKNVDAILYRYVKFDDSFVFICRKAGFSFYSIAHGSSLFQRLLLRCRSLYLTIATLHLFHVPPLLCNLWNEYVTLRGCQPFHEAKNGRNSVEEVLRDMIMGNHIKNYSACDIPTLILVTCCSLSAKCLDCSSSIVHSVTAILLANLGCEARYAVLLESAILEVFDWQIYPTFTRPDFAEVILSLIRPVKTIEVLKEGTGESTTGAPSDEDIMDLLCKEVICGITD